MTHHTNRDAQPILPRGVNVIALAGRHIDPENAEVAAFR